MEQTTNLCYSWKENKGIERIRILPLNLCPAQRREDEKNRCNLSTFIDWVMTGWQIQLAKDLFYL